MPCLSLITLYQAGITVYQTRVRMEDHVAYLRRATFANVSNGFLEMTAKYVYAFPVLFLHLYAFLSVGQDGDIQSNLTKKKKSTNYIYLLYTQWSIWKIAAHLCMHILYFLTLFRGTLFQIWDDKLAWFFPVVVHISRETTCQLSVSSTRPYLLLTMCLHSAGG